MMMSGSDVLLGEAFQLLAKIRLTPRSGGHGLLKKIEVVIHCPLSLPHSLLHSLLRLHIEILQRARVFCHDSSPNLTLGPLAYTAMVTNAASLFLRTFNIHSRRRSGHRQHPQRTWVENSVRCMADDNDVMVLYLKRRAQLSRNVELVERGVEWPRTRVSGGMGRPGPQA